MLLYCIYGREILLISRLLRIAIAASAADDGVDSAISTTVGRYRNSSP
jgi:hypothetical protein